MKKIRFTFLISILFCFTFTLKGQAPDIYSSTTGVSVRNEYISSNAYNINVPILDEFSVIPTASFVHAYTMKNELNNATTVYLNRIYSCLNTYIDLPAKRISFSSGSNFIVKDVLDIVSYRTKNTAICGSLNGQGAVLAVPVSGNISPSTNPMIIINNFTEITGMIETNSTFGPIMYGKTYKGGGIIFSGRGNLVYYETVPNISQLIYDEENERIVFCGAKDNKLYVYTIDLTFFDPELGVNDFYGFSYELPQYEADWEQNMENKVCIHLLPDDMVALSATGDFYYNSSSQDRSLANGILYIGSLDGSTTRYNSIFNLGNDHIYLKGMESFDNENFNLLLYSKYQPNNSYPSVITANPNYRSWSGIDINFFTDGNLDMIKRNNCQRLEIVGSLSTFNFYGQIQTPINLTNLAPIESPRYVRPYVGEMPVIERAPSVVMRTVEFDAQYFTMNDYTPLQPYMIYEGICMPRCLKSASVEDSEDMSYEESVSLKEIFVNNEQVEIQQPDKYTEYYIYDMMGRVIVNSKITNSIIQINSLPAGTYLLNLINNEGEPQYHKFVKQ